MLGNIFNKKQLEELKNVLGPKLFGTALPLLFLWFFRKRMSLPFLLLNAGLLKRIFTTIQASGVKNMKTLWPSLLELWVLMKSLKK